MQMKIYSSMLRILNDRTTENFIAVLACYKNTNHKRKTMHAYTYMETLPVTHTSNPSLPLASCADLPQYTERRDTRVLLSFLAILPTSINVKCLISYCLMFLK